MDFSRILNVEPTTPTQSLDLAPNNHKPSPIRHRDDVFSPTQSAKQSISRPSTAVLSPTKHDSVASIPTPAPSFPSDSDSSSLKHETPPPSEKRQYLGTPSPHESPNTRLSSSPTNPLKRRRAEEEDEAPKSRKISRLQPSQSPKISKPLLPQSPQQIQSSEKPSQLPSTTSIRKPRRRDEPIPIFAQSVRVLRQGPLAYKRSPQPSPKLRKASTYREVTPIAHPPDHSSSKQRQMNGTGQHIDVAPPSDVPEPQPAVMNGGPTLLEPTIVNYTPSEELTKLIADELFSKVVMREDIGVAATGGPSSGAVFEIEAKLGTIINADTNERLELPVLTETIIDRNMRTRFQSSMTERQHQSLNQFLNKALIDSQPRNPNTPTHPVPPQVPRRPINYVHTRERDTFHDLKPSAMLNLPSIIRKNTLEARGASKPRIRVTTDAKTGKPLAQIIKTRIADIDVYSPRTAFDWRMSINVEMRVEGDISELANERMHHGENNKERSKDRMTYRHQDFYQIDLTQVIVPGDPPPPGAVGPAGGIVPPKKEHELEVEVSSQELRHQGLLARDGKPNMYQELVKGFVDNVRLLARSCGGREG